MSIGTSFCVTLAVTTGCTPPPPRPARPPPRPPPPAAGAEAALPLLHPAASSAAAMLAQATEKRCDEGPLTRRFMFSRLLKSADHSLRAAARTLCVWQRDEWRHLPVVRLHRPRFARRQPQPATFDIDVVDRRNVERQQLRNEQSADDSQSERSPRFGAGSEPQRNRQRADERAHRRHHDRPEAHETRLVDRL